MVASGHDKLSGKAASLANLKEWPDTVLHVPFADTTHHSLALIRNLVLPPVCRHVTKSATSGLYVVRRWKVYGDDFCACRDNEKAAAKSKEAEPAEATA